VAIGEIALARAARMGKGLRVIHVANRGALTRYDLLIEMKKILKRTNRIVKVSQDKFKGWVAVRPGQSALSVARYESAFSSRLRSWKEALREHLTREEAACAS
jgi:dTDP-4-dehydrorhamnose reductase